MHDDGRLRVYCLGLSWRCCPNAEYSGPGETGWVGVGESDPATTAKYGVCAGTRPTGDHTWFTVDLGALVPFPEHKTHIPRAFLAAIA